MIDNYRLTEPRKKERKKERERQREREGVRERQIDRHTETQDGLRTQIEDEG